MRNKFILFIIIVLSIILMPNVNAYVNKDLSNNLVMPSGDAIRFYGWQSETSYINRTLAYEQDYIVDMSDYVKAYYYLTLPTNSNDSNGFSYVINTGLQLSANQNYNLSVVLCSTNSNQWWDNYRIGTGNWSTSLTNYATTNGQTYENLGVYYTDSTNFTMCRKISFNYTSNNRGSVINLRLFTSNNRVVSLGQLSFMGYTLSSNGYDYSSQLQGLSTAIQNVNTNINNAKNDIISNNNTNTQNIINNQNTNAQQAHTDAQNMQNTIKDDNVDSPNSSINTIKNYLATNGVITNLVTLPVTLYQSILNSVNSSCSTFSLGSLYGTNLQIPCINVATYIGNTLWGTIDVIISGIFVYSISRKMVKVFNQLSSMKEGDVLDG